MVIIRDWINSPPISSESGKHLSVGHGADVGLKGSSGKEKKGYRYYLKSMFAFKSNSEDKGKQAEEMEDDKSRRSGGGSHKHRKHGNSSGKHGSGSGRHTSSSHVVVTVAEKAPAAMGVLVTAARATSTALPLPNTRVVQFMILMVTIMMTRGRRPHHPQLHQSRSSITSTPQLSRSTRGWSSTRTTRPRTFLP